MLVPDEQEISELPRWARVAFAAFCARRVQPLFGENWPDAPDKFGRAITRAIEVAEKRTSKVATADSASQRAGAVAIAAHQLGKEVAFNVARAAENAASTYRSALLRNKDAYYAAEAIFAAVESSKSLLPPRLIRHWFELLVRFAKEEDWNDNTPVSQNIFELPVPQSVFAGDLLSDPEFKLILRAFAEETVPAGDLKHHLLELYKALNEYTLARYGTHLTRDQFRRFTHAYSEAGVH